MIAERAVLSAITVTPPGNAKESGIQIKQSANRGVPFGLLGMWADQRKPGKEVIGGIVTGNKG